MRRTSLDSDQKQKRQWNTTLDTEPVLVHSDAALHSLLSGHLSRSGSRHLPTHWFNYLLWITQMLPGFIYCNSVISHFYSCCLEKREFWPLVALTDCVRRRQASWRWKQKTWRRLKLSRLQRLYSGAVKDGFKTLVKWENSLYITLCFSFNQIFNESVTSLAYWLSMIC